MNKGLEYDEEASRRLEAMYTTADVVEQRSAVIQAVGLRIGERVLDVGSGPGFLAVDVANVVGPSGAVHGLDISQSMVEMARKRCIGLQSVEFELGDAHALKADDEMFDVVLSTQVLEYVMEPTGVLKEVHRVVRRGGRIGILATDWSSIVWHGPDSNLMERVLAVWNEHCNDPHLPRTLSKRLRDTGFEITDRSIIPLYNPSSDEGTYSGGLIDLVAAFVRGKAGVTDEELDRWGSGLRSLSENGEYFFSLNRYLFVAKKPD
jgi:arsenite methyltransferase